ncbi:hypothetical protein [Thalassolituus oleivorans]|uniref:hypothetical protein n=1 Tax=Thalassolituus oleivorans TaxID=187493 RepID=UPI001CE2F8A7|nr:hypothetical protein [Thalassolituus oleivorans]MCA6129479.1 hypothetical protein [Thalassolituus oleivorans 4BN06-13]
MALTKDSLQLGCLLVNTINELSLIDSDLANHAAKKLDAVEQAFITACERAQTLKQMTTEITPESAGKMLMTSMIGLRVQSRRGVEISDLRQSILVLGCICISLSTDILRVDIFDECRPYCDG